MRIGFPLHGKAVIYPVPIIPAWLLEIDSKGRRYELAYKLQGIYKEEANDERFLVLLPVNSLMVDILPRKDSAFPDKDKRANGKSLVSCGRKNVVFYYFHVFICFNFQLLPFHPHSIPCIP